VTKFADLHIHTFYSDGTSSPQEVVDQAKESGLGAVAITDHDTFDGVEPAKESAKAVGLEVICGIELSSQWQGKDIHILGYFFGAPNALLKEEIEKMRGARMERMKMMIEKLKALGMKDIDFEKDFQQLPTSSLGRPHLAMVLKERGHVATIPEAFEKYLAEGCCAYVDKFKITPFEAIALIRQSGGVAVMAHPMVTGKDELIPSFVEAGLRGIEVYYPNHSEVTTQYYEGIVKKHNLIATGGSDAHGKAKTNTFIGKMRVPYDVVEKLKAEII